MIGGEGPMEVWQCCSEPIPCHTSCLVPSATHIQEKGWLCMKGNKWVPLSLFFLSSLSLLLALSHCVPQLWTIHWHDQSKTNTDILCFLPLLCPS